MNIRKRREPGNEARPYASHDIEPKFTMKLSTARHAALGRCGESNTLTVTSIVKERTGAWLRERSMSHGRIRRSTREQQSHTEEHERIRRIARERIIRSSSSKQRFQ